MEEDAIGFFDHLLVLPVLLDIDNGIRSGLDLLRQLVLDLVSILVERLYLRNELVPVLHVARLAPRFDLLELYLPSFLSRWDPYCLR